VLQSAAQTRSERAAAESQGSSHPCAAFNPAFALVAALQQQQLLLPGWCCLPAWSVGSVGMGLAGWLAVELLMQAAP
jgi:hypothetical protein